MVKFGRGWQIEKKGALVEIRKHSDGSDGAPVDEKIQVDAETWWAIVQEGGLGAKPKPKPKEGEEAAPAPAKPLVAQPPAAAPAPAK